MKESALPVHA